MTSPKKLLTIISAICTIISTIMLFGDWFILETYLGSKKIGSLFDVYFSYGFDESTAKIIYILFTIVFICNIIHCVLCFLNNNFHQVTSSVSAVCSVILFVTVFSDGASANISGLALSPNAINFMLLSVASLICVCLEPNEKSTIKLNQ